MHKKKKMKEKLHFFSKMNVCIAKTAVL